MKITNLLVVGLLNFCQLTSADPCYSPVDNVLICQHMVDSDFPLNSSHYGNFKEVYIQGNPDLTKIPVGALTGISTTLLHIVGNEGLLTIESRFLHGNELHVEELVFGYNQNLSTLPFEDMEKFQQLKSLEITSTGLRILPSNIPWPSSLQNITLIGNGNLEIIEPYAFQNAQNLENLAFIGDGYNQNNLTFSSNSLHITSAAIKKTLTISTIAEVIFETNAFGNVDGGQLWDILDFAITNYWTKGFPEEAFRLLLKSHFNKGHKNFLDTTQGYIQIASCSNCDIAWLYKDAHRFGLEEYRSLIGDYNILCPRTNSGSAIAVLDRQDSDFVALMNSCPDSDMPWPDPTVCQNLPDPDQDTAVDEQNCHCFYHCVGQTIHGHECCQPGLAFNPETLTCDWSFNVSNCDT